MAALTGGRPWLAQVITLYPQWFPGMLGESLAGRALVRGIWTLETLALRDFAHDRHRSVDDTPAGGGPGMVLRADVLARAVDQAMAREPQAPVLALTPRGPRIDQQRVRRLVAGPGVTLLCGRFEGIDERLFEARPVERAALADIVLSGGEPAALAVLDACVRLLPGVMGAAQSGVEESFEAGLVEHPHYTRPALWEGRAIPEVLTSGDHGRIARWRREQSLAATRHWRPDLLGAPSADHGPQGAMEQGPAGAARQGPAGAARQAPVGGATGRPRPGAGEGDIQ